MILQGLDPEIWKNRAIKKLCQRVGVAVGVEKFHRLVDSSLFQQRSSGSKEAAPVFPFSCLGHGLLSFELWLVWDSIGFFVSTLFTMVCTVRNSRTGCVCHFSVSSYTLIQL